MPERKYIDIRVEASDEKDLAEFIRMCGFIQYLGNLGSSREFKAFVDGDGAARFKFYVKGKKIPNYSDPKDESLEKHSFGFGV